jgi:endonuclease/exonuclease/phosphatase (EEP) superfamily protein YafD
MAELERAAAVRGFLLGLAVLVGALAALGHLSRPLNQTLLENMRLHTAAIAGLLSAIMAILGWRLIGAAGVFAALWSLWTALAAAPWTPLSPATPGSPALDVVSMNVFFDNPKGAEVAAWLADAEPDVAVLLEAQGLATHLPDLSARFPHRGGCAAIEPGCAMVVLSRWPLSETVWLALPYGDRRLATVVIDAPGGPVRLFATHWSRDFFGGVGARQAWAMTARVRRVTRDDPTPFIVVGDFNATLWDASVRTFASRTGVLAPRVWRPTWPVAAGPFGFPIDHVFVSPGVGVLHVGLTPGDLGSNHRGIRAAIQTPRPAE